MVSWLVAVLAFVVGYIAGVVRRDKRHEAEQRQERQLRYRALLGRCEGCSQSLEDATECPYRGCPLGLPYSDAAYLRRLSALGVHPSSAVSGKAKKSDGR